MLMHLSNQAACDEVEVEQSSGRCVSILGSYGYVFWLVWTDTVDLVVASGRAESMTVTKRGTSPGQWVRG